MNSLVVPALAMLMAVPVCLLLSVCARLLTGLGNPLLRHGVLSILFLSSAATPAVIATGGGRRYQGTVSSILPPWIPTQHWITTTATVLFAVALFGAVIAVACWARNIVRTARLSRSVGREPVPKTPYATSAAVASPVLLGFRRPVITLPEGFSDTCPTSVLDLICAHEACHARRHDNWRLAFETLVLALLWWCLPLRRIHRELVDAREELCDADALKGATNPSRVAYARVLLQTLRHASAPTGIVVSGIGGTFDGVRRRMERIVGSEDTGNMGLSLRLVTASLILLASLTIALASGTVCQTLADVAGINGTVLRFTPAPDGHEATYRVTVVAGAQRIDGLQRVTMRRTSADSWTVSMARVDTQKN